MESKRIFGELFFDAPKANPKFGQSFRPSKKDKTHHEQQPLFWSAIL